MRKILSLAIAALFSATMFADTWTVAGSSKDLFGSSTWAADNAANDMVAGTGADAGKYIFTKTDVTLPAGQIKFKIVKDHKWDEAYPALDYEWNDITEAGIYDIEIVFDPSTHDIIANAEKTGSAVVVPTVAIKGSWWWNSSLDLVVAGDKKTASATKTFYQAATYEFGVELGGVWKTNGSEVTVTRASNTVKPTGTSGNMKLEIDMTGEYTFTWTYETETLEVTYSTAAIVPSVKMKGAWDAWVADVNYVKAGDEKTASVTKALEAATNYSFKMIIGDDWKSKDWNINRDYNTVANIIENPDENINIQTDQAGDYTFTWTFATNTLTVTYPTATGINDIENGEKAVKELRNGQLFIIKGEKTYNVLGQEVR